MKAKTLALTAIICLASFLGMNLTAAYAASYDTVTKIESNVQTEQKSQKVRDRNRAIGAILGIAAIVAIANHNDKHHDDHYNRGGSQRGRNSGRHDRNTPPPPPMPHHHR